MRQIFLFFFVLNFMGATVGMAGPSNSLGMESSGEQEHVNVKKLGKKLEYLEARVAMQHEADKALRGAIKYRCLAPALCGVGVVFFILAALHSVADEWRPGKTMKPSGATIKLASTGVVFNLLGAVSLFIACLKDVDYIKKFNDLEKKFPTQA